MKRVNKREILRKKQNNFEEIRLYNLVDWVICGRISYEIDSIAIIVATKGLISQAICYDLKGWNLR